MKNIGEEIFNFFEIHLACWIYILMLSAVAIQVFSRYVLNTPIPKLFELSIYSFVWTIYLGAPLAKRYNQHIRFDIFYRRLPARGQLLVDILFDTLLVVVMLILLIPCADYTLWNYRIKASALRIPWTYLLMCFPLFIGLTAVHCIIDIVTNIRRFIGKASAREEALPWL
jgi:TRAP-type C4-dicarboxylate transport system permease small subunit